MHQLPTNTLDEEIFSEDGATLKLDNQKNGWTGVCVYQGHNGDENFSPVMALGRRCVSIRQKMSNDKTYFSVYWVGGKCKDITADNMSAALKFAVTALNYPSLKGIPVDRVETHYLIYLVDNVMSILGYIDRYIQKWGDGEGEPLRSTYERSYIILQRSCQWQ